MSLGAQPRAKTLRLDAESPHAIERAAEILQGGGLVAIPTETVYGLAANALDTRAVEAIFIAKQRPAWDPLIVHIEDRAMLDDLVMSIPQHARALMDRFWPGPLTLLLPRTGAVSDAVTAGRDLVGVRVPAHPVARALIAQARLPLAAPSANRFGHISPTSAEHVMADLEGRIDAVLDAGPCSIGVESTVLDPCSMTLYRQGGVSAQEIEAVTGVAVSVYEPPALPAHPESLPSPGVGMRHYAPRARVVLVSGRAELHDKAEVLGRERILGVLLPAGWPVPVGAQAVPWAEWGDPAALSRSLYAGLRLLDSMEVDVILVPVPAATGTDLSDALRDRLEKASRIS